MVEIYSYDINTHERFANDQKGIEDFRRQYHLPPSRSNQVAIQSKVLNFIPLHPALTTLMQTYQRKMWARFEIPKNFFSQRRSSSYVAPSLGGNEKLTADANRVRAFVKKKRRRNQLVRKELLKEEDDLDHEGETLAELLEKGVKETNEMVDYIISRMHQFVQA